MTPDTDTEARRIAEGLSRFDRNGIVRCEPKRVEASLATLLTLTLNDLADVRRDNTVYLIPLGLRVRAILETVA